jgi:hypothetical protein
MNVRASKVARLALSLTAALVTASGAAASSITVNQSYNLTSANPSTSTLLVSNNNNGFSPKLNSIQPLLLQNGDNLDLTLNFLTGQSLNLMNFLGDIQFDLFNGSTGSFTQDSGVLNLFDTNGNLITSFSTASTTSFQVNGGVGQDFRLGGVPLSGNIGGIELVETNLQGLGGGGTNFIGDFLSFSASSGSIQVTSAVPEPRAWAMMLLGFLGIGVILRHGRRGADRLAQLA